MSTATPGTPTSKKSAAPTEPPPSTGFRSSVESQDSPAASSVVYQIGVHTADVPGAGTDGDVYLWVDGTKGRSGWMYLDNALDNFERNQTDYFYHDLPDLGFLTSAWIGFVPVGLFPDWLLSTVTVNGRTFSYYHWISDKGVYKLTS
jgi:hypothetical protein